MCRIYKHFLLQKMPDALANVIENQDLPDQYMPSLSASDVAEVTNKRNQASIMDLAGVPTTKNQDNIINISRR